MLLCTAVRPGLEGVSSAANGLVTGFDRMAEANKGVIDEGRGFRDAIQIERAPGWHSVKREIDLSGVDDHRLGRREAIGVSDG
jgi:hypothetical protein